MNGLEVERVLDFVEEKANLIRPLIRREVTGYLRARLDLVASSLAETGVAIIPTRYGDIKLTKDDLKCRVSVF